MEDKILEVKNLKTYFYTEEGVVHSVDGLSYSLREKETLAIVGESGCGKSVSSLSVMGIVQSPPGKIEPGSEIMFQGQNLLDLTEKQMQSVRGNDISMIFQEPMTSLNPVFTVGQQIHQILHYHGKISKKQARDRGIDMLKLVGIPSPDLVMDSIPISCRGACARG